MRQRKAATADNCKRSKERESNKHSITHIPPSVYHQRIGPVRGINIECNVRIETYSLNHSNLKYIFCAECRRLVKVKRKQRTTTRSTKSFLIMKSFQCVSAFKSFLLHKINVKVTHCRLCLRKFINISALFDCF